MTLNDLLLKAGISPTDVVVMRHRPKEPGVRKVLHWLAADKPELFNAYQQSHSPKVQRSMEKMCGSGFLASFIGLTPGEAVFAGLYRIGGAKPVTWKQFWEIPGNAGLAKFGMIGWEKKDARQQTLWFDLDLQPFHTDWRGKLTVSWPPPERSWFRRAGNNQMRVLTIREESLFTQAMPDWQDFALSWVELQAIPTSWKTALSHWRGIYYIHDSTDGRGYVGSAYGGNNLLGRWLNYAGSGHGENKLLKLRKPDGFRFSILQRVSPDMDADEVIRLESSWKQRLHTREPVGLNAN